MLAVFTIMMREWRRILKDSRLRSVVLVAPFVYAALMCAVYINHTVYDLPIAVVNQDPSALSRQLVRMLEASPKINVAHRVDSTKEIESLLFQREIDGAIIIPKGFSKHIKTGHESVVTAYVNAGTMVQANALGTSFNKTVQTFSAGVEIKTLMKKGATKTQAMKAFMPVKLNLQTLFNPTFNYSNFMVPGILMTILQQVILLGLALTWTGEKEAGTLKELRGISSSPFTLLLGKSIPYIVINLIVAEIYLRVVFPLNNIPMEGHWGMMISFTVLFVLTVVTWGTWVSALCKTRLFATQILMFVAMPSFILSGFTWPPSAMPEVIQWISHLLPMTYFVHSFRFIYLADVDFIYVAQDFLVLAGFLTINLLLGYLIIKRIIRSPDQIREQHSQLTQIKTALSLFFKKQTKNLS